MEYFSRHIILLLSVIAAIFLYYTFDPADSSSFFPVCPFYTFTKLKCPGCGSQRALHCLLHGDLLSAIHYNAAMVFSIPYLCLGYIFRIDKFQRKFSSVRKTFYGPAGIKAVFLIIMTFTIVRNIL